MPIRLDRPLDVLPAAGLRFDYVQFARLVVALSACLHALRVRPGERVTIVKRNNLDILALVCACARVGAVAAPINALQDPETLGALLERLGPAALIADQATVMALRSAGTADTGLARHVVVVDGAPEGTVSLDSLRGGVVPEPVPRSVDDPLVITHTSGTTGVPKLTVHSGRSLFLHARYQMWLCRLLRIREMAAVCVAFPHIRASGGIVTALSLGLPLLALTDPDPRSVAALLAAQRPVLLETYPNNWLLWEQLAADPAEPFASIRVFIGTFDATHPRTVRTLLGASRRRGAVYLQGYGQSEIGPATVRFYTRRFRGSQQHSRCVGTPMPGLTRIRIVDPQSGRPVGRGRAGLVELATRGKLVTYLREQERWEAASSGPWWRTGDVGFLSRWGCLHLLDRTADAIPGIPSTLQVEDRILERLPMLTEIVVVGSPEGPPVPVICTRDDLPLDRAQWDAAVGDMPGLAQPVQYRWGDIPRTATSKVRRFVLARSLAGRS